MEWDSHSSQTSPPEVTRPLGQDTTAVVCRPPVCRETRALGPPGTLERSVGSVSSLYNCPWEVRPLLSSFQFRVIFLLVWEFMLELNTLPWLWRSLSCPTKMLRKHMGELGWKKGAARLFSEETVDRKEVTAANSPAAHDCVPDPVPWNRLTRHTSLPPQTKVLGNWDNSQVARLRSLHEPQGGWTWRGGETMKPTAVLIPGRTMEPHSAENTVTQRNPSQLQAPDIWALTFRHRHGVFQDRGQARPLPRSPCPSAHRTRSGVNVLTSETMQSHLNIISVDRTWKVKVLVGQSCPTVCDPMDCSPLGSSVHGISQARTLGWFAIPFSRGSSWPRDWTQVSCTAGRFFTIWATREACRQDLEWSESTTNDRQKLVRFKLA